MIDVLIAFAVLFDGGSPTFQLTLTDGEYYRIANKLNEKWGSTELPEPYNEVNT